jgi:tRNA(adenine34) deaminase
MTEAAEALGRWRLSGCTVYVTLEPCLMCAGLMVNSRIDRCVYGAPDPKGGALGTLFDVSHDPRLNHEFEVTSGVMADESAEILKEFFQARRAARRAEKRAATRPGTSGSPDSGCQASPRE